MYQPLYRDPKQKKYKLLYGMPQHKLLVFLEIRSYALNIISIPYCTGKHVEELFQLGY